MTFPTEQDRLFFTSEEAKRIQELREPRFGDWVNTKHGIGVICEIVGSTTLILREEPCYKVLYQQGGENYPLKEDMFVLPRQGQLQEMLEEKGYGLYHLGDERFHPDFDGKDWNPEEPYRALAQGKEPGDYVKGTGPTPAIALGRALIEVMSKEGTGKEEEE